MLDEVEPTFPFREMWASIFFLNVNIVFQQIDAKKFAKHVNTPAHCCAMFRRSFLHEKFRQAFSTVAK